MEKRAKRISFQVLQILKRLKIRPQPANKFTDLYAYSNLYRTLNQLEHRRLITKKGEFYELTLNGMVILNLYS